MSASHNRVYCCAFGCLINNHLNPELSFFKIPTEHERFIATTSSTYSFTLCCYFIFHLVVGCVLLLECSSLDPDALGYGVMTIVLFQQLIQVSVVFELISIKGYTAIDKVYSLPWECMDNKNRSSVLMLLKIVQQSLAVKACGMIPIGFQTMVAILRASLSYFVMLRTFADME